MPQSCVDELRAYYKHCLEYTVQGGKMTRGLTVLQTALSCSKEEMRTEDFIKKAMSVGWAVELLQGFFLIADDVMDSSKVRRGNPCWYLLPNVTYVNAINDSLFVESCCYSILDHEFSDNPSMLMSLRRILSFVSRKTVLGQHLDTNSKRPGCDKIDFSRYNRDRYEAITTHKTAYYTYYLPVKLGLALCGKDNTDSDIVHSVCMNLGRYFQAQDDVLDAFGLPEEIGKVGTDIEEGKLTWLLFKALEDGNEAQKEEIMQLIGTDKQDDVQRVKDIYKNELLLVEKFAEYEEECANRIKWEISREGLDEGIKSVLQFLLDKTYKRKK